MGKSVKGIVMGRDAQVEKPLKYTVVSIESMKGDVERALESEKSDEEYSFDAVFRDHLEEGINHMAEHGYRLMRMEIVGYLIFELIDHGTQITGVTHPKLPWKRKP